MKKKSVYLLGIYVLPVLLLSITNCGKIKRKHKRIKNFKTKNTLAKTKVKEVKIRTLSNIPMPNPKFIKTKQLAEKIRQAVEDYAKHIDAIWIEIEKNSDSKEKALSAYDNYYEKHKKELDKIGSILIPLQESRYADAIRRLYQNKTQKSQNIIIKLLRDPKTRGRFKETIDHTRKLKLEFIKLK